ncbi:ParE toxin of type II toxin-antitoxin system, parDE [Sporobacter termitidis DSM 10068]|uniref:ParE toxin of type II toxin-antitoxin system, parDE n=1 Tax=Sporobacter termitidis DSM 10068 TaxID=1123282 RepID=A0A1M5XPK4_9FIRM|nr:type II toxin-antitoxin system RelE/ParE family toxin [Sporobacter termitidis]SHI01468.1 ParE toxin of type II toxin-antitoxin system, parDE [Sporobacter termitidis DSM 10068]
MDKRAAYDVIVSDRSRQMLAGHIAFLARTSPDAAREAKNKIIAGIRSLSQLPERFPFLDAEFIPPNKYHKMFIEKRYLVLYQIRDRTVYVDYIVDCRQDYGWFMR